MFFSVVKGKSHGICQNLKILMAGYLPLALNLRTDSGFAALPTQDFLLSKINKELPFTRHVAGTFKQFNFIERFPATGYFVRAKEVVVSYPERDAVICAVLCAVTAGSTVGFLECSIKSRCRQGKSPFFGLFSLEKLFQAVPKSFRLLLWLTHWRKAVFSWTLYVGCKRSCEAWFFHLDDPLRAGHLRARPHFLITPNSTFF